MGDDKWAQTEPGSATGSYSPAPVAPEEPPENRPPLPRRKPQARRPPQHDSQNDPATSETVQRVSGSTNPGQMTPASGSGKSGPVGQVPSTIASSRRTSGIGQRRLHLAQTHASAPVQLPDNVRYLFRLVLTPIDSEVESADTRAEPAGEFVGSGPAGASTPERQTRTAETDAARPAAPSAGEGAGKAPKRTNWLTASGAHRRGVAGGDSARGSAPAATRGRGRSRGRGRGRGRRHLTLAAAAFLVAATAVGSALELVAHGSTVAVRQASAASHEQGHGMTGPNTGAKAIAGLSTAAIIRGQAARWVATEIAKSVIIACDDVMCTSLFNEGIAASNLLVLSPTAPDPLGADVVIGTQVLRSQFGRRLATEYAPSIIASFGVGKSRVEVRVVAPDGAASYEIAASRDLTARQRNGSTLLRNTKVAFVPSARPDLIAGLVDSRLFVMLPVLAAQHPIQVLGFFDRAPRSAQGIPLTGVQLAGSNPASGLSGRNYLRWLLGFFAGQRALFRPVSVTTAVLRGHEVVSVRFARPSPIGLLNSQ